MFLSQAISLPTLWGTISGLYYKHITIVNDACIMTVQVVVSPTIVILTTLEVSFMLLANIYSRGVTYDDCHVTIEPHQPLDGVTNPNYKLQCLLTTVFFSKEKNALLTGIGAAILFTADPLTL